MISRRQLRFAIALMLPLMVLRGLLPAGYMVAAEAGGLQIQMCISGLAVPAGTDPGASDDHPPANGPGDCAFALSAGTLAPPAMHVLALAEPLRELSFTVSAAGQLPPATGPPRVAVARAPPQLSRKA